MADIATVAIRHRRAFFPYQKSKNKNRDAPSIVNAHTEIYFRIIRMRVIRLNGLWLYTLYRTLDA